MPIPSIMSLKNEKKMKKKKQQFFLTAMASIHSGNQLMCSCCCCMVLHTTVIWSQAMDFFGCSSAAAGSSPVFIYLAHCVQVFNQSNCTPIAKLVVYTYVCSNVASKALEATPKNLLAFLCCSLREKFAWGFRPMPKS